MGSQVYEFNVEMTCEGCSNAVKKVLQDKEGINNVSIYLGTKKVIVTSTLPAEDVLEYIKKTGKTCSFAGIYK